MLTVLLLIAFAAANGQLFEMNLGGGARSLSSSLTRERNYLYLSGTTGLVEASDILVTKFKMDGTVQWSRKIVSQLSGSEARSVVALPDGGVAFAGRFGSSPIIGRFSSGGRLAWAKVFSGGPYGGQTQLSSIIYASDDSLVAVGQTREGGSHPVIIRVAMDGSLIFSSYMSDMSGYLHAVAEVEGAGYIGVGRSDQSGLIVKFQKDGSVGWAKTFTLQDSYTVFSTIFRTADSFFVAGQAYGGAAGFPEGFVGRIDGAGNFVWVKGFAVPGTAGMELHSVFVQGSSMVIAGLTQAPYRGLLASIDINGQPISARLYGTALSAPTIMSVALAGARVIAVGNSLVVPGTTLRAVSSTYIVAGNEFGETSCPTEARQLTSRPLVFSSMAMRSEVAAGFQSTSDITAAVSFRGMPIEACPAPVPSPAPEQPATQA